MLILHRSERADLLVAALGRLLARPLGDPVTAEVVAVPTRGVERWITQRLSHELGAGTARGDGVCANLDFPFPANLVGRATALATSVDPATDPWSPGRLVWPLIQVIDDHAGDPALAPLVRHMEAATPPPRVAGASPATPARFSTARHLAELFDRYGSQRPAMIRDWAAGGHHSAPGGTEWQPHLWRLLRHRLAVPSPAERLESAVRHMAARPELLDLPERLSMFGLTRMPSGHLAVLEAIAAHRDVHLFLLHPSGPLWERTAGRVAAGALPPRRADDLTARLARHPLLRSWGRDAREMQLVVGPGATGAPGFHYPVAGATRPTLLGLIQDDIRADRAPAGHSPPKPVLDPADSSIRIHSCHGRMRQVEILRDSILHLLQDDASLEARDVIVMCPDIETYAPLIQATFGGTVDGALQSSTGSGDPGGGPVLRARLADRSLRQTNPLLGVAAELLDLAASRVGAPMVVDLAARPPVARRFRFDRDELSTIERWVAGTAVRWGIDAAHRRPWFLGGLDANTWSAGLDRLLLGVAMAEGDCRMFHDTVPYDDMASSQVDLAGRLAEMVSRLAAAVDLLAGPQDLSAWIESLIMATELIAVAAPGEEWQHEELRAGLGEVVTEASAGSGGVGGGPELSLDEVRALLAGQLQGRPTRANFRTGDMTICTLVPMRSVPHRVVALLGLDDGAFPRHPESDGDDLLLRDPHVGDRDARSEDRQLLLDALLAATDHLIITFCGRDERTNRRRPACAPVAELLDVIDATVDAPDSLDGRPARSSVVVAHPLQPFDRRNFTPGDLAPGPAWSFDPVFLGGARASLAAPRGPGAGRDLPPMDEPVVQLEHLVAFVQHPTRAFLRRRLALYLGDWSDELDDRLPLELDPLARWGLGDRLLESVLSGVDLDRAVRAEERRGLLPPGALATRVLDQVGSGVAALAATMAGRGFPPAPSVAAQVGVELQDGRTLTGAVPQVREGTIAQCTYSRLGPKHRLAAWVRFLALTADRPDQDISAVTIGKGHRPGSVAVSTFAPLPGPPEARLAGARAGLGIIADLYDRGMRAPLPMACAATAAWADGRRQNLGEDQLLDRASGEWRSNSEIPGERDQPEHVFVHGRDSEFRSLLTAPPAPDESGSGWGRVESHRFGRLAFRLWDPILTHESLVWD